MNENTNKQLSTRVVQISLLLVGAIALFGGTLQMILGQPNTTPRLDNVHRFMAGVYLSMGIISIWTAWTVRTQSTLIYLIALGVFLGAVGRLVSIAIVGLPEPAPVWIGYLVPELVFPLIIVGAQIIRSRK